MAEFETCLAPAATNSLEEEVVLELKGVFDIPAAWRLREALAQMPPGAHVKVDFSRLRECHDFALAALVQAVVALGPLKLDARGLGQHQERLLSYLGMRRANTQSPADVD